MLLCTLEYSLAASKCSRLARSKLAVVVVAAAVAKVAPGDVGELSLEATLVAWPLAPVTIDFAALQSTARRSPEILLPVLDHLQASVAQACLLG